MSDIVDCAGMSFAQATKVAELLAEIERLRAALAEIAAHDDQFSTPQQARVMRDAARRALEHKP